MSEPTYEQLRAVMLDSIRDVTPEWVIGRRLSDIPALMFAVRTSDIYALVLQRTGGNGGIEVAAMTRDGNVIPLAQDVKFPDEEVKK